MTRMDNNQRDSRDLREIFKVSQKSQMTQMDNNQRDLRDLREIFKVWQMTQKHSLTAN